MSRTMRIILLTLAAAGGALGIGGAAFVYSGVYDTGATGQHTAPVYWLLDTAMRRSVKQRSHDIAMPALERQERVAQGFRQYRAHCVQCHGAPGIAPEEFAMGMLPAPANLVATAREWDPREVFQVVKYGIRMSGMPAWKYRMSDEEIWDLVAFMRVLPALSPADYAEWNRRPEPQLPPQPPAAVPVLDARLGDPRAGRAALEQYLCVTCHSIPGIVGANRSVGPPLDGIAGRKYIAGVLPNTPGNMAQWIRHPTRIDPLSAMPDLQVSEQDARDIAAYLYTLDERP